MSQVGEHALKETVDGFYMKTVVVVKYVPQRLTSAPRYLLRRDVRQQLAHVLSKVLVGLALRKQVELHQDAVLHFTRGLVGESDGQNVAKSRGRLGAQGQGNEVEGQFVGLARTRRGTVDQYVRRLLALVDAGLSGK